LITTVEDLMNIDIKALGFSLTEAIRDHVADRVDASLGRFSTRVNRVVVRLSDVNGPRGGLDKRCQLQLLVDGHRTIVIQDREADLYLAVNRAADRAARSLARQLQRSRTLVDRRSAAEVS
jgi:putative sigma-54 modulation protein